MFWLLLTVGFSGFVILSLRGPVERQLNKMHERKLAKINANKELKQLKGRVAELEEQVADEIIKNNS